MGRFRMGALAAVLVLSGCDTPAEPPPPCPLAAIGIHGARDSIWAGGTLELHAVLNPCRYTNRRVGWSSSNPYVAGFERVTDTVALLRAVRAGDTQIRVWVLADPGDSFTLPVRVINAPPPVSPAAAGTAP